MTDDAQRPFSTRVWLCKTTTTIKAHDSELATVPCLNEYRSMMVDIAVLAHKACAKRYTR